MMHDRAALLERCLRLEARLLGVPLDPPAAEPTPPPPIIRRIVRQTVQQQRKTTPADVATMRALRAQGLSYVAIGRKVSFSESTVRIYTRDVQVAR